MKKEAIVIGAGMVGVSIAWHLQQKNYQVTLIDKKAPGEETSYGNAGLIQREAIFPHPFPRALSEMLRVMPNKSLDIRYRPTALMHYAGPLFQYWKNSADAKYRVIVNEWQSLIAHSTSEHQRLIEASSAEELVRKDGWLQLHRSQKSLDAALKNEASFKKYGVEYKVINQAEIKALEPDLNCDAFVGGIHWLNAWQVTSPGNLTKKYAESFKALGGEIIEGEAMNLNNNQGTWSLEVNGDTYITKNLVIATGPWSGEFMKPLGYHFPLFPMRGYHTHYRPKEGTKLNHSIVDEELGFVLSPQILGIRLTTGAEFTFRDAPIKDGQMVDDEKVARELLQLEEAVEATPWFGHRPCMPDMKPVIGAAHKHQGLWFAFGHAHQGFTLGPATGRLMAEMINGETPYVNPAPFAANRF